MTEFGEEVLSETEREIKGVMTALGTSLISQFKTKRVCAHTLFAYPYM